MIKKNLFASVLGLVLIANIFAVEEESLKIKELFQNYVAALSSGNGLECAEMVSDETLKLYSLSADYAVGNKPFSYESISPSLSILVLQNRWVFSSADLKSFSGKDLFQKSIEAGLIRNNSLNGLSIEKIVYTGDKARCSMAMSGKTIDGFSLIFIKSRDSWKFDYQALLHVSDLSFKQIMIDNKLSPKQFALSMIQQHYGRSVDESILLGPIK